MAAETEAEAVVVVRETVLITPAHLQESSIHPLSNLDQLNAGIPCYFPILYYFRSGAESPSAVTKLFASLKQALADVLDVYPVLAGTLRKGKGGRLEVEQNGAGIEFWEATTEASLDEWKDLRFCPLSPQLVPKKPFMFGDMMLGAPLVCVQVTAFRCGGVAISISFLHAIGDMQAFSEFVEVWASIHKGQIPQPITPCLRTAELLRPRDPPAVTAPIHALLHLSGDHQRREDQISEEVDGQNNEQEEKEEEKGEEEKAATAVDMEAAIATSAAVLRIADAKVAEAVEEVQKGPFSYGRASSFEAVAGLLWVAITRARAAPPHSYTRFALPVNMRQRWRPPLPPAFFGNAALPAVAVARSGDLVERHFSYAASLLRQSTEAVDAAYGQAAVDWLEMQLQRHGHVGLDNMLMNGRDVHASVMVGFPMYELDFGWGRTIHVALPFTAQLNGASLIMSSPRGGRSRDIPMWLKREHMTKLLADPLLSHYLQGATDFQGLLGCWHGSMGMFVERSFVVSMVRQIFKTGGYCAMGSGVS